MKRRTFLAGASATASVLVAGCSGDGDNGGETTTPEGEVVDITETSSFDPTELSIDTGETVTWTNNDDIEHTVTSTVWGDQGEEWSLDETLASGEQVSHTFDSAGIYEYYCTVHGEKQMCGVVKVGGASRSGEIPCNRFGDVF